MARYRNSRNFDGDTYDDLDVPSDVPFVSFDVAETARGCTTNSAPDDYDFQSLSGVTLRGASRKPVTRYSPTQSHSAGSEIPPASP